MKNKIISISCVFILLSFLFVNSNVYATNGHDFIIPEGVNNYIIAKYVYCSDQNKNYYVLLYSDTGTFWQLSGKQEEECSIVCFEDNTKSKLTNFYRVCIGINDRDFTNPKTNLSGSSNYSIYNDIVYSTVDIYDVDGKEIFFQPPVQEVTLAQVLAQNNPVKSFQTMMCGIIPYLIALVLGLVAFWKAWSILLKELRKA